MRNESRPEQNATRMYYSVEYTDAMGRRRRLRRGTLMAAERTRRGLRMGSDPVIRIVTRKAVASF